MFAIAKLSTDPLGKRATFDHIHRRRALDDRLELGLKGPTISSRTLF